MRWVALPVFALILLTVLLGCERSSATASPQSSSPPTVVATPATIPKAATAPAPESNTQSPITNSQSSGEVINDPSTGRPRIPHPPAKPGELLVMTIKELGNFDFDPNKDDNVPADVRALNGARVRLRGFMLALTQADQITDFALMPTLGNCCYGVPPGVQHTVTCRIPKNKALTYVMDEVSVEGRLTVNVKREDGYTYSIFELDVTSVKLAQ